MIQKQVLCSERVRRRLKWSWVDRRLRPIWFATRAVEGGDHRLASACCRDHQKPKLTV